MSTGIRKSKGFSIIELVVVMAMLGVLAAIAVPSFTAYVARGHRSEARSAALESAQWMHRFRTERGGYGNAAAEFPAAMRQVNVNGRQVYDLAVASTADGFTITVTPTATGPMNGDVCASITIDNTGALGFTGNGARRDICWGR